MADGLEISVLTAQAALDLMPEVAALYQAVFAEPPDDLAGRAAEKFGLVLWLARDRAGRATGFKLGYQRSRSEFYSWLGGVDPSMRGAGIARALMRAQHAWLAEQGYLAVHTETMNRYRAMLLLNIQEGFDVVGTHTDDQGLTRIMLRKRLAERT